jgi:hypothetical protein
VAAGSAVAATAAGCCGAAALLSGCAGLSGGRCWWRPLAHSCCVL